MTLDKGFAKPPENMEALQKILIVDGDERILRTLEGFLLSAGFQTKTATAAHVALNFILSQEYDLVFVSDRLADCSLDQFLRELQRLPTRPLVVVMESDPPRACDAGSARPLGKTRVVNKWRPCDVLTAATEILSSARTE
ncbi:MAG: hypothetical protein WB919_00255 [Candidatus Sulfotelmatobacter sp.]